MMIHLRAEEIAAITLLILYHVALFSLVKWQPNRSVIGITRQARCLWIKYLIEQKQSILAIQTLRNWIMQSTVLGATSSSLSIGLIAFLATTSVFEEEGESSSNSSQSRGLLKIDASFPIKIGKKKTEEIIIIYLYFVGSQNLKICQICFFSRNSLLLLDILFLVFSSHAIV